MFDKKIHTHFSKREGSSSALKGFACPACGDDFHHGSVWFPPIIHGCEGSFFSRLFRQCPPKDRGQHFHVVCTTCTTETVVVLKERQ